MGKREKRTLTIKNEMFLLSVLFLTLVALIFAGIFLKLLYDQNMNHARNSLKQCNSQIVTYTEGMFHENAMAVRMLAQNPTVISGEEAPSEMLKIFDIVRENNQNITYIYSGYSDGNVFISGYETSCAYDSTVRPWYQAAKDTDGVARLVYSNAVTKEWLFSQCMKLSDSSGQMVGAIAIDCSNESISSQLSTKYQYDSQRSYIVGPTGTVLIHPEEKYINDSLLNYMDWAIWSEVKAGLSNYGEYKKAGVNAMAYFEQIPETNFIVVTAIDASEVTRPLTVSLEYLLLMVTGISIVLGLILSQILMYRFAGPIIALESRIRRVADGGPNDDSDFSFSNVEINGIAKSIEVIAQDIARREEERKVAEYLSFHDSMTGIYNRRFYEEELQRLDKRYNYPLCIICCDINGLKLVNDVFGHDAGDELIGKVTKCLKKSCRAEDILARVGGDEFSIIMPRVSAGDAERVILRAKAHFSEERVCGVAVTASLGYAIKEKRDESLEEKAQQADQMMYAEKMRESAENRRNMLNSIIAAAENEGLVRTLTEREDRVLARMAAALCPGSEELLKQGYWIRRIGRCAILQSDGGAAGLGKRHTEIGYRFLCVFDEYRNIADSVLHYTEHWDGSGWPAGLSGRDIPLMSRMIGAADGYFESGESLEVFERNQGWYDAGVVAVLRNAVQEEAFLWASDWG